MNLRLKTYSAYSIGTAIVWALIVVLAWLLDSSSTANVMWLVSLGSSLDGFRRRLPDLCTRRPKNTGNNRLDILSRHASERNHAVQRAREVPIPGPGHPNSDR